MRHYPISSGHARTVADAGKLLEVGVLSPQRGSVQPSRRQDDAVGRRELRVKAQAGRAQREAGVEIDDRSLLHDRDRALKGGAVRAKKLSASKRRAIAKKAANTPVERRPLRLRPTGIPPFAPQPEHWFLL